MGKFNFNKFKKSFVILFVITIVILLMFNLFFDRTIKTDAGEIAYSSDGQRLAAATNKGVEIWDLQKHQLVTTLEGLNDVAARVAWSLNGQYIATKGISNTVLVWDANNYKLLHTLTGHTDSLEVLKFSSNSQMLASGGTDNSIIIWNIADGRILQRLEGLKDGVHSVAFSPDDKLLASGSGNFVSKRTDYSLRLWETKSGSMLRLFELDIDKGGPISRVDVLEFSPDGHTLAVSEEGLKLWDINSGDLMRRVTTTRPVHCLAFDPTGQFIAVGYSSISASGFEDNDNSVSVFKVKDGSIFKRLEGHSKLITSLVFSPDSKTLASSSEDGTIRFWQIN